MSGALQITFQNMRSFAAPALVIGDAYEGGFYAGQISTAGNGIADYNLVVGPVASAQSALQWKTSNTSTPGTTSVITGPANSAVMNDASHPAAQFCEGLTVGGFSDWYMPAKNELEVCYYNLKPLTAINSTGSGINTNAVPARASGYTASGLPTQTSAANFQSTGAQAFASTYPMYWSSTEYSAGAGSVQFFGDGVQGAVNKNYLPAYRVRAVRRVAIVPTVPTVIGQAFGGGFYAGQISTAGNGIADYYLVTGPVASAQGIYQWKTSTTTTAGTSSVIDGPANSTAMNDASHPAAQFCEGLTIGGFSDWYMPAKNELEVCYYNLKPTTQPNEPYGINPNSVPARTSTYTGGSPATNPAQTSAAAFKTSTGAEAYTGANYWTSTQATSLYAWKLYFPYGGMYGTTPKTGSYRTRAVRRVAV